MIAFVLSGGGSRGALQVGALKALMERGIRPGLVVGTSVGAINAACLAADPTYERVEKLAQLWRETRREHIYPGSWLNIGWRVLTGQGSLYSNETFSRFLKRHILPEGETFGDLAKIPCLIVVTNLETGAMRIMGERPSDPVVETLLATTALPPLHPPVRLDDGEYVDGAAVALLPVEVALQRGAREVYALHIIDGPTPPEGVGRRTVLNVAGKTIGALVQRQWETSVAQVHSKRVRLHHIKLFPPSRCPMWDYSKTDEMIAAGYEQTRAYLASLPAESTWQARMRQRMTTLLPKPKPRAPAAVPAGDGQG